MESIPYHPLLQLTQEERMLVRQSYDLDVKKINENLDAIEEWCKKQDHLIDALPYMGRDVLERFHILGRGSIERTKIIIDKVLTIRGMLPEFLSFNPKSTINECYTFMDNVLITPLPKPNPKDNTRIFLVRLMNENFEDINLIDFAKISAFILEIRLRYEYIFSDRLLFDLKHVKASIITKLNPVLLKKVEIMFTEAYKTRVKGIHAVNAPPFINKLVNIFKQILKEKFANRMHVHTSYEDLYREIPKEVLPKDYGGDLMNCSDIVEQWKDYLKTEDVKNMLEIANKIVSNESRRTCVRFNEEYLGMPGSFKQLNVD